MDTASVSMNTARASMDTVGESMDTVGESKDTVGESMDAMGAVMNGNVNQEKKKISLGCGQAQRFGEIRPASIGTRFKTREGKRRCVSIV